MDESKITMEEHELLNHVVADILKQVCAKHLYYGTADVEKRCISSIGDCEEILVRLRDSYTVRIRVDLVDKNYRMDEAINNGNRQN